MKLKQLLKEVPLEIYAGNKDISIVGIAENSKFVGPGFLFIAKKGQQDNGAKYIDEAIAHGAVAILSNEGNPFLKDVVQLIHPDIQSIEGKVCSAFYNHPSKELFVVGITGTNGKTTVGYLLRHLFTCVGIESGLIGTVEYIVGNKRYVAERTTPDVIANHKMLKDMISSSCQAAILEVTSHGLMQGRVDEIDFDAAIFTNLTHDHLDYHKTFENYAEAKQRLFTSLGKEKTAIVWNESPMSEKMVEKCQASKFTYGFSSCSDLYASDISLCNEGTSFNVTFQGKTVPFSWNPIGRHNVLNCLAALSVMVTKGFSLEQLQQGVSTFHAAPGRLERVKGSSIFVDYAHSPDALENVLKTMIELKKGKIITVFGCGGDRDQKKRPVMAKVAETFSDITIVTSDNPRTEEPAKIIDDIIKGFTTSKFMIEIDRAEAIKRAVAIAKRDDLILIAGKGHETYQIFAHQRIPFDDIKVAEEALKTSML